MNTTNSTIVQAALEAKTPEDADAVQSLIAMAFGADHYRPLGDKPSNYGTMASAADYDLKLVEAVTNMQDAVVERAALVKYGSRAAANEALGDPRSAVDTLFEGVSESDRADMASVTFFESDPPADKTKKFTAVFDDRGTGISNAAVPKTIFGLGGGYKEDALYLQGAFGLGGELTYRNADYVVLVTRKAPELLVDGEEDRITVAVVEWRDRVKTKSAEYLVDREWVEAGDVALPWSCPASDYPEFAPGTHLALISYVTAGLFRKREGDSRTFDTIVNTRLVRPILPTRWRNYLARGDERATVLRGLDARLDNTKHSFPREEASIPFVLEGKPYFLRVAYVVFNDAKSEGKRATFVAHDHCVLFTSNGQVQAHWTPAEFKSRTRLKKLDGRVLVEVDLDTLPVDARTSLFTADRAGTVKSDMARRLDEQVAAFLNGWESLKDENDAILQEQLKSASAVSTRGVTDKIRRAFAAKGFGAVSGGTAMGGPGGATRSGGGKPGGKNQVTLHVDPTTITGPASLRLELGKTRFVSFWVDAFDEFFESGRGEVSVEADEAFPFKDISEVIAVDKPHKGQIRVSFAIPDGYEPTDFVITLKIADWTKSAGGLGDTLNHVCAVSLVEENPGSGVGAGGKATGGEGKGAGQGVGANAVLLWDNPSNRSDWTPATVGQMEQLPAASIANLAPEYHDLLELGDQEIQCITLNDKYPPLVGYLNARAESINSTDELKARYAIGVGVEMLVLLEEQAKLAKKSMNMTEEMTDAAYRSSARGVLAVLPEFDRLVQVAELEDEGVS